MSKGPPRGPCGAEPQQCGRGVRAAVTVPRAGRRGPGVGPRWWGGMRGSIDQAWAWRLSSPPPWLPVSLLLSSQ